MAGDENISGNDGNKNCKYCRKNVVTTVVKCSVCEAIFHPSCALRVAGLVVVGCNNLVKCCIQQSEVMMSTDKPLNSSANNELMHTKDQLIISKDLIIIELKDKEAILKEHINLLKEKISNKQIDVAGAFTTNTAIVNSVGSQSPRTRTPLPAELKGLQVSNQNYNKNNIITNSSNLNVHNQSKKVPDKKVINAGIVHAQTSLKMQDIINLDTETQAMQNNDDWRTVARRKKGRKFMVGNNETTTNIQTIPRYVSLHVTRLAPGTKSTVLQSILQPIFKEVKCEEHTSKHPDTYGSMKVTIRKEELQKAWKREIWPNGALISFFRARRMLDN